MYAAKTCKLLHETARLINFKGHLPEIKIDADYINKLKQTKLSPSDKAEKIIRDIETVIRQNEANSAAYVEFQQRLDELVKRKREEAEEIEEIINKLLGLYTELDELASLPQRMGFEDKGRFEIYTLIKNATGADFNDSLARQFVQQLYERVISRKIFIGWQDVPAEVKRLQTDMEVFALADEYETLKLDEHEDLMEKIMKAIVQNYSID